MNDGKVEEGLIRFHYDKTSVKNQNMRIKTITKRRIFNAKICQYF